LPVFSQIITTDIFSLLSLQVSFLRLSCLGFFLLLSCSGLTGASPDTFLSVIYCLTCRVQLDRGSFNPDYPIKSDNDSKESKSGNDCKIKIVMPGFFCCCHAPA
jgi:hypothetical protein